MNYSVHAFAALAPLREAAKQARPQHDCIKITGSVTISGLARLIPFLVRKVEFELVLRIAKDPASVSVDGS
jgi:hypothetical protein